MMNYPQSEDEMKVREYFNRLGNLSQNEIKNYVNTLNEKYSKHLNTHERDSLVSSRNDIENPETSIFKKLNSLERIAKSFKEVEEDLGWIESFSFKKDFGF